MPAATREVVFAPAIAKLLREQCLASRHNGRRISSSVPAPGAHSTTATPAKPSEQPSKPPGGSASGRLHSLRHTFASLLIARRLDVVFVSRQLGHANPSITLKVYAHLYATGQTHALRPQGKRAEATCAAMVSPHSR